MSAVKEYIRRARFAYCKFGGLSTITRGRVETIGVKAYVVLSYYKNDVAVYRIENCGRLKRLKRWPKAVAAPLPKPPKPTVEDVLASVSASLTGGQISGATHGHLAA